MTRGNLEELSREELIRELEKLETAEQRFAAKAGEPDRERLIHELNVHQVELEMQNHELREAQLRLEAATSRYSDLYDFAPVGYCTLDPEGGIKELNLTAAALLGAPRQTLLGRPFSSVVPLQDKHLFHAHLRRCLREKARVTSELTFSFGRRGKRTVQIISDPVRDPIGAATAYRTILVDVSDLKALENRLRLLSAAGESLTSSLEFAAVLEAAARIAVPPLSDLCLIDVASEAGTVERRVVLFADPKKQATLTERLMQLAPLPGWQTPQARVIASGEPMLLSEVSAELRERTSHDDALRAADVRSVMVVPLSARGRTFGALTLAAAESERRYTSLDLGVAQDLASRIALALDNARLYDEAQRANQSLRLSEAKSSGIVSISADAIISIDEDQRITLFNEGAEKIFGYSTAEVMGAPIEILVPERLRAIHRQHVERFAAGEEVSRRMGDRGGALLGLRKGGQEFPAAAAISKLEVDGEKILTVALRDVTEEKRIESDQRLLAEVGLVLNQTLDYEETLTSLAELAVRDLADFCIVDVIEEDGEVRRLRVVARDPSSAQACESLREIRLERSRPHPIWSALETKQPILIDEVAPEVLASWVVSEEHLRLLRALAPRSIIAAPLLSRVGAGLGAIMFLSRRAYGPADLRLVGEVAKLAAHAIENARLYRIAERAIRARDNVLAVVAHDLRNPLANVLMQAALLRRSGIEPEGWSLKAAEMIERAATRMSRLIQDLLEITRMEAGQLSLEQAPLDAGRAISEIVETQRASTSLALRLDLAPDLGEVYADRDRLHQVLENLIGNAVKFSQPGGHITVGAAPRGDGVLFWVEDTGAGIEAGDLPHLFERFWQARKNKQGVGLGLSIVKAIIEAHGGRIWVESHIGVGSTFFFTLPLARPEPHMAQNQVSAPERPAAESRIVLVTEDDPDVRDLLRHTLEDAGYQVATASNGAEALEYLHREAPPSLVILDLEMPVMDGWAFLRERNRDPELRSIPVLVVSSGRDVEDRVTAAHASYVEKPILPDRLLDAMELVVH